MSADAVSRSNQVNQVKQPVVKKEPPFKVVATVTVSWENLQKQQPNPQGSVSKPVTMGRLDSEKVTMDAVFNMAFNPNGKR